MSVIKDHVVALEEVVEPWLDEAGSMGILRRDHPFVGEMINRFGLPSDIGENVKDRWVISAHHLPSELKSDVERMGGVLGLEGTETLYLATAVKEQIGKRIQYLRRPSFLQEDTLYVFVAPFEISDSGPSIRLVDHFPRITIDDLPEYYLEKVRSGCSLLTDEEILNETCVLPDGYVVAVLSGDVDL